MAEPQPGPAIPFADGIWARVGGDATATERVLWVHGYTIDSSTWAELWGLLPAWRHVGIDLPGHGASAALRPGSTLRELGQQLAQAAVAQGIHHVVGLSLGSMIALQLLLSAPDAFETLTLAAPALAGGPVDADVGRRYQELGVLYHRRGVGPWMTELWMRCPPATFAYASPSLTERLAAVIDRHVWSELGDPGLGVAGLARQAQDATALGGSTARLLLLIGEHELPAFRRTAGILGQVRRDARLVELPTVGHLCILQVPHAAAPLLEAHWRGRSEED